METRDVPPELLEIVDRAAGREHSRDGSVARTLAQVLTRWEELRRPRPTGEADPVPPYGERAMWLVEEAARLLLLVHDEVEVWGTEAHAEVRRWLDNYGLHVNQVDHPPLSESWRRS